MSDISNQLNKCAALNPEVINNSAVYALLSVKYSQARESDINIQFEVFLNPITIDTDDLLLIRMLGILLDNAIDAAKHSPEKLMSIRLRDDSNTHKRLLIIENTYSNKDVDEGAIFDKGVSSKQKANGKSRGLGLWQVRNILEKNMDKFNLQTTKDEKFFKQQFEIFY